MEIASPAVKPAVPNIIASLVEMLEGHRTAHWLGILMYSENPPLVFIPRSKPVTITEDPMGKCSLLDCSTIPAASIPGV